MIGAASDCFLSAGPQACLQAIENNEIGKPTAATAFIGMKAHSERYITTFGGALFDMGPYYLTALIALLGPVVRVSGSAQKPFETLADAKQDGKIFEVDRPTTIAGILDFANGGVATFIASVDACCYHPHTIEIHGPNAILFLGDANGYRAVARIKKGNELECELSTGNGCTVEGRGLGVAEMAVALRADRAPRASGELAYHVLDIMQAMMDASQSNRHVYLKSTCARPVPFDMAELAFEA